MRDSSHDTSLLLPRIDVNSSLLDSLHRRLLKGVFICIADIPDMGHNPKRPFAELLPQDDRTGARCVCSTSTLGWRTTPKVESTEEIIRTHCSLAEPVDVVDVQLRGYVMVSDNDLEFEVIIGINDDGLLLL